MYVIHELKGVTLRGFLKWNEHPKYCIYYLSFRLAVIRTISYFVIGEAKGDP